MQKEHQKNQKGFIRALSLVLRLFCFYFISLTSKLNKIFLNKVSFILARKTRPNLVRGFTILFASLIGSLVMAIGMAILGVTIMQINLSSAGRESQHAFYSADTGTECALYLNYGGGNPDAGTATCPDGVFPKPGGQVSVCDSAGPSPYTYKCQGQAVVLSAPATNGDGSVTTHFESNYSNNLQNTCFIVDVTKNSGANANTTSIQSRGYSTCDPANSARFERAINTNNF